MLLGKLIAAYQKLFYQLLRSVRKSSSEHLLWHQVRFSKLATMRVNSFDNWQSASKKDDIDTLETVSYSRVR